MYGEEELGWQKSEGLVREGMGWKKQKPPIIYGLLVITNHLEFELTNLLSPGKIADTVKQVEELRKSLALKQQELDEKNDLANQKLKQMVRWALNIQEI